MKEQVEYNYSEAAKFSRFGYIFSFLVLAGISTWLLFGVFFWIILFFKDIGLFMENAFIVVPFTVFCWGGIHFLGLANKECPIKTNELGISIKVYFFKFFWVDIEWNNIFGLEEKTPKHKNDFRSMAILLNENYFIFRVIGMIVLNKKAPYVFISSRINNYNGIVELIENKLGIRKQKL